MNKSGVGECVPSSASAFLLWNILIVLIVQSKQNEMRSFNVCELTVTEN